MELPLEGARSQEGCSQLPVPPSGLGVVLPPEAVGGGVLPCKGLGALGPWRQDDRCGRDRGQWMPIIWEGCRSE